MISVWVNLWEIGLINKTKNMGAGEMMFLGTYIHELSL